MAVVFVSIGSNINKDANIASCIESLKQHFGDLVCSSLYLSKAFGFEGDDFYNMAVSFQTSHSPQSIAQILDRIEKQHGRVKGHNSFVSRELDLDQILYDDLICDEEGLCLPRKEITEHAFVLVPLAEIAASLKHPVLGISYAEILAQKPDWSAQLQRLLHD